MEPAISLLPLGKERPLSLEFAETHAGGLRCLVLDPLCRQDASAVLFQYRGRGLPVPLFAAGPLAGSLSVSPWVAPLDGESSELSAWIETLSPPGWGMFCHSPYDWDPVIAHLRSLVLARDAEEGGGQELVFRFWDNRILMRIARGLPHACARLMGPLDTLVTQDEEGEWFKIANPHPACTPPDISVPWYVFDDAHAALFADRAKEATAFNVAENIYSYMETNDIPLPPDETLKHFALRQLEAVRPLGIADEDELTSYVLCALYIGEESAFRQASSIDGGRADVLRALWRHCADESLREEA